jgi:hypothetical protein
MHKLFKVLQRRTSNERRRVISLRDRPDVLPTRIDVNSLANLNVNDSYAIIKRFFTDANIDREQRGFTLYKPRQWGKTSLAIKLASTIPNTIMVVTNKDSNKNYIQSRLGINYHNLLYYQYDVIHRFLRFDNYNVIFDEQSNNELDILLDKVYPKKWVCLTTPR